METTKHHHRSLFKGFLFGGLLGAAAGILFVQAFAFQVKEYEMSRKKVPVSL